MKITRGLNIEAEGSMANHSAETGPVKMLQKHIERRERLWSQLKMQYPDLTQSQLEARLEQFGA
jgi:hypothetical protein